MPAPRVSFKKKDEKEKKTLAQTRKSSAPKVAFKKAPQVALPNNGYAPTAMLREAVKPVAPATTSYGVGTDFGTLPTASVTPASTYAAGAGAGMKVAPVVTPSVSKSDTLPTAKDRVVAAVDTVTADIQRRAQANSGLMRGATGRSDLQVRQHYAAQQAVEQAKAGTADYGALLDRAIKTSEVKLAALEKTRAEAARLTAPATSSYGVGTDFGTLPTAADTPASSYAAIGGVGTSAEKRKAALSGQITQARQELQELRKAREALKWEAYTKEPDFEEVSSRGELRQPDMTEHEARIYNYLIEKDKEQGTRLNVEYGKWLYDNVLQPRKGAQTAEDIAGIENDVLRTAAQIAYGGLAGLERAGTGLENALFPGAAERGTTPTQHAAGQVREDLAEAGPKIGDVSLGQIGLSSFAYSLMQPCVNSSLLGGSVQ